MKKQYLAATLFFLTLVFYVSSASAQDVRLNTTVDNGTVQVKTRATINAELRAAYEARRAEAEAQREKMRLEAEARRTAAQARGDEVTARREAMKVELETKRAEMDAQREAKRAEFEAKRAEFQARRVEFQQSVAKRKVENTARVILATIERLENIIIRVESRIAKVKAGGGITVESERFVASAKTHLSTAKVSVEAFASIDLSSDKASDNFERIRIAAAEAREHIRAAHQDLMMAVRSLGAMEVEANKPLAAPEE